MRKPSYWTETKLRQLDELITLFEKVALDPKRTVSDRREELSFLKNGCEDENIRSILGGVLDRFAKSPQELNSAICKARGHVKVLRGQ